MSNFCIEKYLFRISIVVGIIVGVAAFSFIVLSIQKLTETQQHDSRVVRDYPYFTDIENRMKDTTIDERTLIQELWNNQKNLDSMRTDLMSDIRQETNNNIDKVTSELNFWVAILAMIGVFVPIALTYKGERDFKDKFEKTEKFTKQRIDTYLSSTNYRLKEKEESIDKKIGEFNQWEETFKELKEKYDGLDEDLNLEMSLSSIASIRNNRILESNNDLKSAYLRLAIQPMKRFLRIFEKTLENKEALTSEETKWNLIKMSFQMYDILRNLTYDHSGPTRPRYLYQGEESVKKMIKELMNELPSMETVKSLLEDVKNNVRIIIERIQESEETASN